MPISGCPVDRSAKGALKVHFSLRGVGPISKSRQITPVGRGGQICLHGMLDRNVRDWFKLKRENMNWGGIFGVSKKSIAGIVLARSQASFGGGEKKFPSQKISEAKKHEDA